MARTPSTMMDLNTPAADFSLMDVTTKQAVTRYDYMGRPLLVMFVCNHCPFVVHLQQAISQLAQDYRETLAIVAINANDAENYPEDSPERMVAFAQANRWFFPYLFDESQGVAKAYQAACTPDFFLFNDSHRLVYRGQFDGSRPGNKVPVTGADLRQAVDNLLASKPPIANQQPSLGCNIKWQVGNEPDYFG